CPIGCDCEISSFKLADKIIPNSQITYRIIKAITQNMNLNICEPINTPSLYDMSKIPKINNNKKYDIVFCCYSWRRNLKNIDLVKRLCMHRFLKNFNILVVGNKSELSEH